MAEQEYPTLNEVEPSWADVAITIVPQGASIVKTTDIQAIKWSDKVDIGTTRGTSGGRKKKRTTGQYDADGSITFYKSGWKVVREALKAINPRITLVVFDIMIQHTPPVETGDSEIHNVKIVGCRVAGRGGDSQEGTDAEKIEVPLNIMLIDEDGATLL